MADDNKVELDLVVDASSAKKSLDSFEKSAEKSIGAITGSFKLLAGAAAAALAFVGAKGFISFLQDSTDAAAANEAEVAKLEASLKSLGDFTPEVVDDFKAFADQLESTSKFSDDAAIAQLAFAKQLGLTNDDAKKLVQTAADLASVTGDSLESAVTDLTNSYVGQVKSLGKVIPEVKSFTEEQLKAGAAVDFIAERLKGAASNAIQTYAGGMIQLQNAQEDFQKAVGSTITQNPVLIAAIRVANESFQKLTGIVEENKAEITGYISALVKLAVATIPVVIESFGVFLKVVGVLTKGLTALTAVTADAIAGFLEFETVQAIINASVSGVQYAIGSLINELGELVRDLKKIPGAGKAFEALGFDIDEVSASLIETGVNLKDLSDKKIDFKPTIKAFDDIKDGAVEFGIATEFAFDGAQSGIEAVAKIAKEAAAKISKADGEIAKAAKEAGIAQTVAGQAAVKASVEASKAKAQALEDEKENGEKRKKLAEEAQAYADRVLSKESSGLKKIQIERERDLAELQKYKDAGVIIGQKAADLEIAIHEDTLNKENILRKQQLDDYKKNIQEIASTPFKVVVDQIEISPDLVSGLGEQIAGGLGAINQILKGKEGAKELVAGIGGAFADAFIPGIGPAVSQLLSVFAQGPEAVKALVKDFVAALPEVITAIAESAPAFVDALVETLVNKGGAIKIGVAIGKAMLGITSLQAAGKQVFSGFSLNLGPFFTRIGQQFTTVFANIGLALSNSFKATFGAIGTAFTTAVRESFASIGEGFQQVFGRIIADIGVSLTGAFSKIGANITAVFGAAVTNVGAAIGTAFTNAGTAITNVFRTIGTTLGTALSDAFKTIGTNLKNFLFEPINRLIEFLSKFKFPEIGGSAGEIISGKSSNKAVDGLVTIATGGLNKALGGLTKGFKFAGGGIVPPGFPNDTANARLTSNEMILPPDISQGMQDLIRNGSLGGNNEEAMVAMLTQLGRIAALLAQPQTVNATAELDGRALAQIILQLNRNNARLSA